MKTYYDKDTNPNLIVFDNGVLSKDGLRPAAEDEYVSTGRSCGYDYEQSTEEEKEKFLKRDLPEIRKIRRKARVGGNPKLTRRR